ncbi:hypothetical protein J6590_057174 [Homalodisca vitripennis]|nr:hypothetical protein J6590_057174 [Homalodisca vitripennis]
MSNAVIDLTPGIWNQHPSEKIQNSRIGFTDSLQEICARGRGSTSHPQNIYLTYTLMGSKEKPKFLEKTPLPRPTIRTVVDRTCHMLDIQVLPLLDSRGRREQRRNAVRHPGSIELLKITFLVIYLPKSNNR